MSFGAAKFAFKGPTRSSRNQSGGAAADARTAPMPL
eukprot:COSAG06_NODE_44944_length_359_cov_0.576923_1_plen_35_part_01